MHRPDTNGQEAWLLCWGFVEITEWAGGPKAEAAFSELAQDARFIFILGRDADNGIEMTFVFDPSTARTWGRSGFVDLSGSPFNFSNRTTEAIISERRKRSRPND